MCLWRVPAPRSLACARGVQLKSFAAVNGVHVWLVAHPRQLQQWRGEPPTLYDIAGSAHFINKADVGLIVHRDFDGAIAKSGGGGDDGGGRHSGGGAGEAQHPLQGDPLACRIIIRKVRPALRCLARALPLEQDMHARSSQQELSFDPVVQ